MKTWRAGSGLVTLRCGDSARMRAAWPWRPVRHAVLRASAWLELAGGLGEVEGEGTAVVCLSPPRVRDAPRLVIGILAFMVAAVGAASLLTLVWPPLLALYGLVLAGFCARTGLNLWRDRGVSRLLAVAKPAGGWCLHNLAGHPDHRGAGRALLQRVVHRADAEGRTLYLDTAAARLVDYYGEFGFEAATTVACAYGGEAVVITRMVRQPR